MPLPAYNVACSPRKRAHRRPIATSPSSTRLDPTDSSGVPTAIDTLQLVDEGQGFAPRCSADGGGRVQRIDNVEQARVRVARRDHACCQVLDGGKTLQCRILGPLDIDRQRCQPIDDVFHDDRVFDVILLAGQQAITQEAILGGIGPPRRRTGERGLR